MKSVGICNALLRVLLSVALVVSFTPIPGRAAEGAQKGLKPAFLIGFRGGAVMGLLVVGCSLFGVAAVLMLTGDSSILLGFSFGASSLALFAKAGGGIFTKAADVAADLTGKVELGIAEDDPRNPATIADNVGDNVGDVAGMGADLYESYVGSIQATFALGATAGYGFEGILLPVALAFAGIVCSILGSFLVKTKENATQKSLLASLRTGTYVAAVLSAVCAAILCYVILPNNWLGIFVAILCGLVGGCAIGYFTEYFTSDSYKPTQELAATSETGSATIIIGGLSLGMKSTLASILIVAAAVLISYFAAGGSNTIIDAAGAFTPEFNKGLYGIGIAGVGMLSTLGITLATDAYGPVADNAGGIAEMAGLEPEVRKRTDALDSLGNTTAATGKGFAIGSAALATLSMMSSYLYSFTEAGQSILLNLIDPMTLAGALVGAALPFLFSGMLIDAVAKAARKMVVEVRRQFREIKGLLQGEVLPDYKTCIEISSQGALKEMRVPAVMAILFPVVCGFLFGAWFVGGLLIGATISAIMLAIFTGNAGGAWDNAKKYVETGAIEGHGKGSPAHDAAVVGDTVGDPLKDTVGPSLDILIKIMSVVSLVTVIVFQNYNLVDWIKSLF